MKSTPFWARGPTPGSFEDRGRRTPPEILDALPGGSEEADLDTVPAAPALGSRAEREEGDDVDAGYEHGDRPQDRYAGLQTPGEPVGRDDEEDRCHEPREGGQHHDEAYDEGPSLRG